MTSIQDFEVRLKTATQNMNKNHVSQTIGEFKNLQKDITAFLEINIIEQNDQLSEMQIAIFNNLACLYERKGKYRSSLYHLQIAQELQNKLFTHKYNHQNIPLTALQKLSTTYSNLSAIQSKLGNYKQAILNAEFAIQILTKNQNSKDHKSLVYLYYNYSFLLDVLARYSQSSKYAVDGLRIAQKINDKHMINNYQHLLESLSEKLAKRQSRKLKEIKKYIKGQLGIVKNHKNIKQQYLDKTYSGQINNQTIKDSQPNNRKLNSLKEYLTVQQKYFPRPSRHNSTYTTLNNNRRIRNFSQQSNKPKPTLDDKTEEQLIEVNKDVIRVELQSQNTNRIDHKSNNLFNISDISGKIKRNKLNNTIREGTFQYRIKSKKLKLQQEIQTLNQKNDTLQKIIQKIYKSQNRNLS